jgi:hypothetical protein
MFSSLAAGDGGDARVRPDIADLSVNFGRKQQ